LPIPVMVAGLSLAREGYLKRNLKPNRDKGAIASYFHG